MSTLPHFLDDSVQLEVNLQDLDSFPEVLSDLGLPSSEQEPHYSPISPTSLCSETSSEAPLSPFSNVKFFYNIPKYHHSIDSSQISELAQRSLACYRHHSVLCKQCSKSSILPEIPHNTSPQGSELPLHLSPNPLDALTLPMTDGHSHLSFGRPHCTPRLPTGNPPEKDTKQKCSLPVCIGCQNCTCNSLNSLHITQKSLPEIKDNTHNTEQVLVPPLSLTIPEAIEDCGTILSPAHNSPLNTPELLQPPSPQKPLSKFSPPHSQSIPSLLDIVVHPTPQFIKHHGWSRRPRSRKRLQQRWKPRPRPVRRCRRRGSTWQSSKW